MAVVFGTAVSLEQCDGVPLGFFVLGLWPVAQSSGWGLPLTSPPPFKLPSRPDFCGPPGVGGVECGLYEKPNPCLVTHEWREITVWCRVLAEAEFADYHPYPPDSHFFSGGLGNRKEDWQLLGAAPLGCGHRSTFS